MMGKTSAPQGELFYEFSLEAHVPPDHLLRSIDRFVDLGCIRQHLAPFYSSTGRPSIDPELMIRMLLIGYCCGIRSERRLCEEVHLNLAYRWFCRLELTGAVPDHSTFSKNRHGRFRDSGLFRELFEHVVARCIDEGLVGGETFASRRSGSWASQGGGAPVVWSSGCCGAVRPWARAARGCLVRQGPPARGPGVPFGRPAAPVRHGPRQATSSQPSITSSPTASK